MPGVDIYSIWLDNQFCKNSGSCLTEKALIYTPNGPISIKDIRKGDLVFSLDENGMISIKPVVNQWSRGTKECFMIKSTHRSIEATANHPFLLSKNKDMSWELAENVTRGDLLVCPSKLNALLNLVIPLQGNWNVELTQKITPRYGDIPQIGCQCNNSTVSGFLSKRHGMRYDLAKPIIDYYRIPTGAMVFGTGKKHPKMSLPTLDEDLAYLCGFYLGDGWITKPKRRGTTMGSRLYFAKCNLDHVNNCLMQKFASVFLTELPERKNMQYECCNTFIADIFELLCGHDKAKDKSIPQWIYQQSNNIQKSFISGLIDSDGWITKIGYGFSSCSEKLATGLACLLDYCGYRRSNIGFRSRKVQPPNSKTPIITLEYSLVFRTDDAIGAKQNHNCQNKFESYSNVSTATSTRCEKVVSVKSIGERVIYDIEVLDNHNFIANNIVVHNSFACPIMSGICALILAKHRKTPNSSTPCETPRQMMQHLQKYSKKIGSKKETGFGTIDLEELFDND